MKNLVAVLAALALSMPGFALACSGKGEKADSAGNSLLQQSKARDQS